MVNINIEVPEEVHKEVKMTSVIEGITLKEQIVQILEKEIQKKKR